MFDLSKELVDEKGEVHPCPLEHFNPKNKFLAWWEKNRKIVKQFRFPLCHPGAEKLVRDTLFLPTKEALSEAHLRRAVVVAALFKLRQQIGSCFATAPAILIQEQQPERFIQDLLDLLSTGRLKRTFSGVEYSVPLIVLENASVDCALLRAWEYTLAAFSEVKMEFSRWNLYLSLGLHPEEKGGVGEVLYRAIDTKLVAANKKIEECELEYERAHDQLRAAEALLRQASTESEIRRFKVECQARYFHLQSCQNLRDKYQNLAHQLSRFFSFLIRQYDTKFQHYFQEIYDPKMAEYVGGTYEDCPAGFRLVYKHGRIDPNLWTPIEDSDTYIRCLSDFFVVTESQIVASAETSEEKEAVSEMTTAIIQHVRSDTFLEASLKSSAKHGRKPWAYTSGGTMETLLKTYYCQESLTQESRWIQDPLDLAIFMLDILKAIPKPQSLLMQSPSHAFILHPEWDPFCQGWKDNGFTYTWLRDQFILPMQHFYRSSHALEKKEDDSFLFQALPLIPAHQCQAALQKLVEPWLSQPQLPDHLPPYVTAHELRQMACAQLKPQLHLPLAERARQLQLAPQILRFADTNWENADFAFVVNPSTLAFELWRVDASGTEGTPMTSWKPFFGDPAAVWTIFTNPKQYQ